MNINKIIIIGALFLTLTSCAEQVNTCSLTHVYHQGHLVRKYIYANDEVIKVEFYDQVSGDLSESYVIVKDNMDRIDMIQCYYADGSQGFIHKLSYDTNDHVQWIYWMTDTNADSIPDIIQASTEFIYNGNHEIIESRKYNSSNVYINSRYYTWTNGNLTLIEYPEYQQFNVLTYDNQPSYNNGVQMLLFASVTTPEIRSVNNPINDYTYNSTDSSLISVITYNYSYNNHGYPVTESATQNDYEYSCHAE
jgi:hypothetical protein